MALLFDPENTLGAIQKTLSDKGIRTVTTTGELRPPCVQIMPPALGIDDTEEGFDVAASDWTLYLWAPLDTVAEVRHALEVLAALRNPTAFPTHFAAWKPGNSGSPDLIPVGPDDKPDHVKLYRRMIVLEINHT